jgi:hypothetical protein
MSIDSGATTKKAQRISDKFGAKAFLFLIGWQVCSHRFFIIMNSLDDMEGKYAQQTFTFICVFPKVTIFKTLLIRSLTLFGRLPKVL